VLETSGCELHDHPNCSLSSARTSINNLKRRASTSSTYDRSDILGSDARLRTQLHRRLSSYYTSGLALSGGSSPSSNRVNISRALSIHPVLVISRGIVPGGLRDSGNNKIDSSECYSLRATGSACPIFPRRNLRRFSFPSKAIARDSVHQCSSTLEGSRTSPPPQTALRSRASHESLLESRVTQAHLGPLQRQESLPWQASEGHAGLSRDPAIYFPTCAAFSTIIWSRSSDRPGMFRMHGGFLAG